MYLWKIWPFFVKRWRPVWIRACSGARVCFTRKLCKKPSYSRNCCDEYLIWNLTMTMPATILFHYHSNFIRGSGSDSLFTIFLKLYGVKYTRVINSGVSLLRTLFWRVTPLFTAEAFLCCGAAGEKEKERARGTVGSGKREERLGNVPRGNFIVCGLDMSWEQQSFP